MFCHSGTLELVRTICTIQPGQGMLRKLNEYRLLTFLGERFVRYLFFQFCSGKSIANKSIYSAAKVSSNILRQKTDIYLHRGHGAELNRRDTECWITQHIHQMIYLYLSHISVMIKNYFVRYLIFWRNLTSISFCVIKIKSTEINNSRHGV